MAACEQGHLEVIRVLIKHGGAPIVEFRSTGGSPLHAAISCDTTPQQQSDESAEVQGGQRAFETVSLLLTLYRDIGKSV